MKCANSEVARLRDWPEPAKTQARAGQIKWSGYYKELFARVAKLPELEGKPFYLRGANVLIDASTALEDGRISTEQFESFQREMTAAESE